MSRLQDKTISKETLNKAKQEKITLIKEMEPTVHPISVVEMIKKDIKPAEILISPWLREKQISMVYAPPGIGKTFFCLNCANILATGGEFLRFKAPNPINVLYVDGEMSDYEIQDRLKMICHEDNYDVLEKNLKLITPSIFPQSYVPTISSSQGQLYYEEQINLHHSQVIFFDNLSTLTDQDENKAHEWSSIQRWFIKLKNQGKSIVQVHHTNKGRTAARGTSKREDVLNTVIFLEQIRSEKNISTNFKVKFTKNRSFYGKDADSFIASFHFDGSWSTKDISNREHAFEMIRIGMSAREIAQELGVQSSTVYYFIDEYETLHGILKSKKKSK